ncbi:hypothetical protein DVJ83_16155 (plasmid) [Deinococcus wulumuqiensis]|uniref:Type II secretion system protein n=1 Tax=Deinococcus wulumuqiensis TaxID=980427 RepID=A0A345ILW3_9DEIO|nr:hypothetical protein DVJ83_16155 [Deinococcus wulumuqiensis]
MHRHNAGVTIAESLLAATVLLIAAASFAMLATQSARTTSSSQLAVYGADALSAAASAVQRGNPRYLQARALNAEDLQLLASTGGRRAALRPALRGEIKPLGGDPPRYLITIQGPDFQVSATATAPGGSP